MFPAGDVYLSSSLHCTCTCKYILGLDDSETIGELQLKIKCKECTHSMGLDFCAYFGSV